jgi:hypothetical protein
MRRAGILLLLLAGCASDPDMRGSRDAAQYQTDLVACQNSTEAQASDKVKRRFPSFLFYYVNFPREWRHDVEDCLVKRGYDRPG